MIATKMQKEILDRAIEGLEACHHVPDAEIPSEADISKILFAGEENGWGPEHDSQLLLELKTGGFVVIGEGEDTTGHGCQCGGDIARFKTLDEAVRLGLTGDFAESFKEGLIEIRGEY